MANPGADEETRPNIVLLITDQERRWSWIPDFGERLPGRQWLRDHGTEFTRYYTNSVPCSPSRATLFTGLHVSEHGVRDNVLSKHHRTLDHSIPTLGHRMREAGYRTAYVGKWHLDYGSTPDMEAYGFGDWSGDDWRYMGFPLTGMDVDQELAGKAIGWLRDEGAVEKRPWFLVISLVNPHDIVYYPVDQDWYQERNPAETARIKEVCRRSSRRDGDPIPPLTSSYPEVFHDLPANFSDDLFTKPEVHREWMRDHNNSYFGRMDRDDTRAWVRQLDYYLWLHEQVDPLLGQIFAEVERLTTHQDVALFATSDHGDMCGAHGLRSKGPFVYEENVGVPLCVVWPSVVAAGATTDALGSHVDLFATIAALGGGDREPVGSGVDLGPVLRGEQRSVRDHVLFEQDMGYYRRTTALRYALRGFTDGERKYARYFGGGGAMDETGHYRFGETKLYPSDAPFEDQDHELYDEGVDPLELENLANYRDRRHDLRRAFDDLMDIERADLGGPRYVLDDRADAVDAGRGAAPASLALPTG